MFLMIDQNGDYNHFQLILGIQTEASLSGVEPEFKFAIATSSNEENDSKPFVDCSLSEEKYPQSKSLDVYLSNLDKKPK
ncbi:hypothetical protein AMTRI_Chr08g165170 [Amborella trichopoda]